MVGMVKRKPKLIIKTNIEVKLLVVNQKKINSDDIKLISIDLIKKNTVSTNKGKQ